MISIIVPVYNIENYIDDCIQSLLRQTYDDVEIILVDDGSTDKSGVICDQYRSMDIVRVFHKTNGGLSDARNYGIERAKGEILAFVDGDDLVHPQMYQIMENIMIKEDADIVSCSFLRDDKDFCARKIDTNVIKYDITSQMGALRGEGTVSVYAWNKLYRRELFDDIKYPLGKLHEDEYVFHRLIHKCRKIVSIYEPLYFYRKRAGSIIDTLNQANVDCALEALKDRIYFFIGLQLQEAEKISIERFCFYNITMYKKYSRNECDKALFRTNIEELRKEGIRVPLRYSIFVVCPKVYFITEKMDVFFRMMKSSIYRRLVNARSK
ncbi:glycosyltransferase family 2 protein [Butyrivibrio sp. AE3006]|uniref:glycosyltransferase family 2 protein n=1 Tax=Butyrivibrio sp. AE3006 TaxID=1280673 RepID=UPI00040310BD|nr:glycosyltransferase [Butyrivibrio sp. AE3006]